MKALRARFGGDDGGSTEVIGYIMTFAISAIILIISTQAFLKARENTDHVVTGVELKGAANRVSTRILQAGLMAQEFPNATMTVRVRLHESIGGKPYEIEAAPEKIVARLTYGSVEAEATTYKLDVVRNVDVTGKAYSSSSSLTVEYAQTRYVRTSDWQMPSEGEISPGGAKFLTKSISIYNTG